MSIFTTILSASDGAQVTGSVDIKGQGLITAGVISGSAVAITGSAHLGHPTGQSALVFSRIDSDIQADEQLGSIQFGGRDSNSAGIGAEIRGEAVSNWLATDRRATDIKFFTQDNTSGVNSLTLARLVVSSSGGVGADIHIHTPVLQVGTGGDGNQGKTAEGVQARVSACTTGDEGDAGIEIEAGGSTHTSALTFARDANTSERQGWYVDWNEPDANRLTYRWAGATDVGASPIAITDPANYTDGSGAWTVRVGGGGSFAASNAAWDKKPSLLVTSSYFSNQSLITIRNMNTHSPSTGLLGHKDAVPGIAWNYQQKVGNKNDGIWTMGIEPYNKSLTIGSPSGGLGTGYNRNTTAMVFGEAGDDTKVGIGGDSVTWGPGTGNNTRSLIPSATLHVGNQKNNAYSDMNKTLTQTSTILLDNSINGSGEVQATLTFDVSTQSDVEYHSAHIACVNDGAAGGHTSYLSTGLYDGTGNKDSTRSRMRVDSQGGIIVLSGTVPGANTGWPRNGKSFYDISAGDVPSGSISLISLMDGTYGKSQPTLNLVSWTGTDGNKGNIVAGDELGRITWWSSDSGNSGTDNDRTAAFIQAVATLDHGAASESPAEIQFFTRWAGDSAPQKQMIIGQGGELELTRGGILLGGNQIKDSGDNVVIYFDGSGNLRQGLDIKPQGPGTHVSLNMGNRGATNDTIIKLGNIGRVGQLGVDYSDTSFKIGLDTGYDDFGATAISIDSALRVTLSSSISIGGSIISDGGNNTVISWDGSQNVTLPGDLFVDDYARIDALRVGTTSTDPGDGNLYVEGEIRTTQIAYTDGDDAIVIEDTGYIELKRGSRYTNAVRVDSVHTTQDDYWIQWGESWTPGINQDTAVGIFLVSFSGIEANNTLDWTADFIVSVKFTGLSSGSPAYYVADGTYITVEPLNASVLEGFDPTTDISLEIDTDLNSKLWIKAKVKYKNLFVSYLGGGAPSGEQADTITDYPWRISVNQGYSMAKSDGSGNTVFGRFATKEFAKVTTPTMVTDIIEAKSTNITLDAVGDIILSADGDQITMDDGTTTRFTFNVDSTPELDVVGAFKLDGSSTVEIESTGNMTLDSSANITLDSGADVILSAVGAVSISENVGFQASTYQYLDFSNSIKSTDLSQWRASRHSQGDGLDFSTTTSDPQGLIYHHWIAPCDGSFVSFQFESKYNFKSSTGNNTGNDDKLYFRMYKMDFDEWDASSTAWAMVGSGMYWDSDVYSSYSGFFGPNGWVFATKRTGNFTTFGEWGNGTSSYETSDGSTNIEGSWVFNRGDKIVLAMYWNPHNDSNPFYDAGGISGGTGYTTDTNDVKINAVVRLDWNTGYNL